MSTLQQHARRAAIVLALATLLGACSHGPQHPGGHAVTLTGAQEVPANTSTASGSSTIRAAHDGSVSGGVSYTGMLATVAHIHEAPAGANGPVIVALVKTAEGMFAVPAGSMLTPPQYASYQAGKLYVNVHSAAYPAGEIRAQLKP
ncbi:CHRD domain-containing protein [Janthinobacterium sp. UMAB-56]|uniref:CHRD domain-containing protein n=1 Tax=Janthinobacterium sp. UMAB-56 TaxID=1365361 RepID=UPI001C55CC69|nr:CHRD domain-containing protein [Janthinobacterium sp. UMAB-56]